MDRRYTGKCRWEGARLVVFKWKKKAYLYAGGSNVTKESPMTQERGEFEERSLWGNEKEWDLLRMPSTQRRREWRKFIMGRGKLRLKAEGSKVVSCFYFSHIISSYIRGACWNRYWKSLWIGRNWDDLVNKVHDGHPGLAGILVINLNGNGLARLCPLPYRCLVIRK